MAPPLSFASEAVRTWFAEAFAEPTPAQAQAWPKIASGASTLLLAPTGSGKTLAAFLVAIDRLMFSPEPAKAERCKVLYVSPLKALAVDVERNLRAPVAGIVRVAERLGLSYRTLEVAIRSGDTPAAERTRMLRQPPDILITTPESLYLLLGSAAGRAMLSAVEALIIDEIHALAGTKRGSHLFLSLERLEAVRTGSRPLQRVGLSATQRPLAEIARLLGGGALKGTADEQRFVPRPVEVVDAGARKALELWVDVPVEDMARLGQSDDPAKGPGDEDAPTEPRSIWPAIYPRLVELIRTHRSTMIFVNNRRLSERLSQAINEAAGAEIALAHHGSVAKERRAMIEDRLKRGDLPAIVATSSLELGIDMGAVDLVIQIEAPPSIASGLQRVGRAGHQVGAVSKGVIFPKYRGDLLACAAALQGMATGQVEETVYPRNALDVLAQQIVAEVSANECSAEALFRLVRGAAPYADLTQVAFDGVLDMLSGRYPSDDFAELRARITWDRMTGMLSPRQGARLLATLNGGTIPDRGLFGVFLAGGDQKKSRRVGELDEEMVFESRPGEVFVLGASSWRIEEITHDRVLVSPAPGESGKMPFWHGDSPGRPHDFGAAMGRLCARIGDTAEPEAAAFLRAEHGLDARAAANLIRYVQDQREASALPTDRCLVLERFVDEIGDLRVCVLSPFGARVHAPWTIAVTAVLEAETGASVDAVWTDDGMVFRFPESDRPPDDALFFPAPDEVEALVVARLGATSIFASRFRENAGRALLLPKRQAGKRTALWAQRRRASDLLAVAARYPEFPIVLETFRECLRDVFDLPALIRLLERIRSREVQVKSVATRTASPFASALLFSYVANFIYDGDAPLAERRAHALSIDHAQLRALLGEAELRTLFEEDLILDLEARLQRKTGRTLARHPDHVHDLLLSLGDLSLAELVERAEAEAPVSLWLEQLAAARRIVAVRIAGQDRFAAVEDVARFRDALGVVPPRGVPEAFLAPVSDPLGDLISRYARTHGPFPGERLAARFGLGVAVVEQALTRLAEHDRVVEGEFLPGGRGREWCDAEVLRRLKRGALARLRKQVEPVDPVTVGRFLPDWQGLGTKRSGLEGVLSAIESLQGAPIPASVLESEILPARVRDYSPHLLDTLCAAGEVVWRGVDPIGQKDGRIALYLTDHFRSLAPSPRALEPGPAQDLLASFETRGALFFSDLVGGPGDFGPGRAEALWDLVWAGLVTNDTLAPLRSRVGGAGGRDRRRDRAVGFRSRRLSPPGTEGRWSQLSYADRPSDTERASRLTRQLLDRYGVLTREAVQSEGWPGGFSSVYPVLKALEEAGKVRRGYFIDGIGGAQFAWPGADDRLRSHREPPDPPTVRILAATDPANPYGAILPWPGQGGARPQRAAGSQVVLLGGALLAYLGRTEKTLLTFLPEAPHAAEEASRRLVQALAERVEAGARRALLVTQIDGVPAEDSPLYAFFVAEGFSATRHGLLKRRTGPAGARRAL